MLEGSVRKAGGRVRITAQLVDGSSNDSVWAERYDRDLNDIFALQDEISQAIVKALKLKLLPEEKKAIEQRGTTEPRGLQPAADGAAALRDRQRGRRPPQRGDHSAVPPCHGDRPELRARWALMAVGQMLISIRDRRAGRRRTGGRRARPRARREPGRGARDQGADSFRGRPSRRSVGGKSRSHWRSTPSPTRSIAPRRTCGSARSGWRTRSAISRRRSR